MHSTVGGSGARMKTCSLISTKAMMGIFVMRRWWGTMKRILPVAVIIFALAGFADSLYLSLAHFGLVDLQSTPGAFACAIGGSGCQAALTSELSTIAGVPSAVLGAAYFAAMFGIALARIVTGKWPVPLLLAPLLLAGLSFSGYLLNTIASDVDNPCRLCLIAHAINVVACVMAFASMYLDGVAARLSGGLTQHIRPGARGRWRSA